MTRKTDAALDIAKLVWHHVAAFVALVLIVLALFIGFVIGRPSEEPEPAVTQADGRGAAQMYTCSMHPSVRLPNPDDKCPICFMDLIPVNESGGGNEIQLVLSESAARMSGVETARVARFFPSARVRLFGKLTYAETKVARITAYFPGRLDRLFVNYVGVPVAKGDHLAEIYSPQLLAAFEEIRQARISVDSSTAASPIVRTSTERMLDAAREKLRLLGLTEEQITAAESGTATGDRLTIYTPIGGVVTHLAAREGDYVDTGSPIATVADLSYLWLDLEAYESQLPMLRWGQPVTFTVEAHPGELFDGRISFIEPIVDERTRTAAVRVTVANEKHALKPGMFATATVRPRVAAGGVVLSDDLAGRWVSPMHPTVVKDGPGQCDICGMDLVPAELLGVVGDPAMVTEPLVIPRTAAMLTGARAIVYVKVPETEQPTYEAREVRLGTVAGDFYVVKSGLNEGEEVVVAGAFRIDSAMQILAKPSMMAPHDGGAAAGDDAVPESFVAALTPIYAAYLTAQEALAADDLETFLRAASDLADGVGFVEEAELVGAQLGVWRSAASKLRLGEQVATIEGARAGFENLSDAVLALDGRFGHAGAETWHVAYCPMAFDFKGASWLQRGTEINNPYFGASMLRCGEIRDARPARDAAAAPAKIAPPSGEPASQPEPEPDSAPDGAAVPAAQAGAGPEAFVLSLTPIYAAYLIAQEALAADDLATFHQAAGDLETAIEFVDESPLGGADLDAWRSSAAGLAPERGATMDEGRAAFETMSMAVLALDERFGHGGPQTWHVAYCPMAFDFKGASWLQRGTTINNPYFGASMLRCGSIRGDRPPFGARGGEHEGHDHE